MPVGDLPESVTLGGWWWQVTLTADEFGVWRVRIDGVPDDARELTLDAGGRPSPALAELLIEIEDHRNAEIRRGRRERARPIPVGAAHPRIGRGGGPADHRPTDLRPPQAGKTGKGKNWMRLLVRILDYTLAAFFLLAIVVLLVSHLTGNSEPDTPAKPLPRRELSDILTWPDRSVGQTSECDTPVWPASRQTRWSDTSQREPATGLFKPDLTYNCQATDKPHRELSPRPHQPVSQVTTGEYPVT